MEWVPLPGAERVLAEALQELRSPECHLDRDEALACMAAAFAGYVTGCRGRGEVLDLREPTIDRERLLATLYKQMGIS